MRWGNQVEGGVSTWAAAAADNKATKAKTRRVLDACMGILALGDRPVRAHAEARHPDGGSKLPSRPASQGRNPTIDWTGALELRERRAPVGPTVDFAPGWSARTRVESLHCHGLGARAVRLAHPREGFEMGVRQGQG